MVTPFYINQYYGYEVISFNHNMYFHYDFNVYFYPDSKYYGLTFLEIFEFLIKALYKWMYITDNDRYIIIKYRNMKSIIDFLDKVYTIFNMDDDKKLIEGNIK